MLTIEDEESGNGTTKYAKGFFHGGKMMFSKGTTEGTVKVSACLLPVGLISEFFLVLTCGCIRSYGIFDKSTRIL